MNPQIVTGPFTLGGAVVAFAGIWLTQNQQRKRDSDNDERALRDAKHERLSAIYRPILAAAYAMNDLLVEPEEDRNKQAVPGVESHRARLLQLASTDLYELALESDAKQIREALEELRKAFVAWQQYRSLRAEDPHSLPPQKQ